MQNKKNRGQAIAIEVLIAVTLFLVFMTVIITIWENKNASAEKELTLREMEMIGSRTLDYLTRSPGEAQNSGTSSEDWEDSASIDDVLFIGLAKQPGIINADKLLKFVFDGNYAKSSNGPSDYKKTKTKLLITGDFNYYFKIENVGQCCWFTDGSCVTITEQLQEELPDGTKIELKTGAKPDETKNTYQAIVLKRVVSYEGKKIAKLRDPCSIQETSGVPTLSFWIYKQ